MKEYRNFIILGVLFLVCVIAAVHASHDNDPPLLAFSIDSAKQILAAILTTITVAVAADRRKTDSTPIEEKKQ